MRRHAPWRFCIRTRYEISFFGFQVGRQNGTQVSQSIGYLTIGDVLEILPFEDPLVVLEISGKTLWEALEASLATWPAQEG
jgi:2',3'-cyclic-nucleotide 2'-phosphodiesterase (5'-nucleotidase family)